MPARADSSHAPSPHTSCPPPRSTAAYQNTKNTTTTHKQTTWHHMSQMTFERQPTSGDRAFATREEDTSRHPATDFSSDHSTHLLKTERQFATTSFPTLIHHHSRTPSASWTLIRRRFPCADISTKEPHSEHLTTNNAWHITKENMPTITLHNHTKTSISNTCTKTTSTRQSRQPQKAQTILENDGNTTWQISLDSQ